MTTIDVYSYGVVSSSTQYSIHGEYPQAQGYAEIANVKYATGGEATNSSVVLARLGASVRLDGNWLGDDDNGRRTKSLLDGYGIDSSRLVLKSGYSGVQEMIVADHTTRTIFGTYGHLLERQEWNAPSEADIEQARVVSLDPFFGEAALAAARPAAAMNKPVITVDCRHDDPLLKLVSAVVIAESYLHEQYADTDPEEVFRYYQSATPGAVIFTFGSSPGWFAESGAKRTVFEPFAVDSVDTTGGGDAFRAGIVFGYLKEWSLEKTVRFAAATAAIVCTRFPGVHNSPSLDEVEAFIAERTER